jgi:3-oxoacyl-[acyl-carrier protein] reductase
MIDPRLSDKVVLLTGGNHGIGAATVRAFGAQEAAVFLNYLGTPPADAVVRSVREAGGRADAWEADLADPAVISQLFDRAERAFGPVDILINNAAYAMDDTFLPPHQAGRDLTGRPIQMVTPDTIDRHFVVNSRAPALLIAEFARRHLARRAKWGRIVSVSTEGALGSRDEVSYWASKSALESFTRSAAEELARSGVTVNIVSPGAIQTGWIPKEKEATVAAEIPLGRVGQPADVADVIVFLASDQARWLTGQTLFVGGGRRVL